MKDRFFASDNNATVHPKIMDAIIKSNQHHAVAYGDDAHTKEAINKIKEIFGDDLDVYFVYNGTGANVLALSSITNSFNAIVTSEYAHINVDECGAPEKFTGCKLIDLPTSNGKITVSQIKPLLHVKGDEHHSQPKVISITQTTELGTLYTVEEVKAIADFAHENDMLLHVDGARISNAAASLGKSLREITVDAGVDVLSFGMTKNGLMFGEAVIFFGKSNSSNIKFLRKQGTQLSSKMRFIACQFTEILSNDLWLENASHANKMAKILEKELQQIPEVIITQKVESNGLFVKVPKQIIAPLQEKCFFYVWDDEESEVRWMASFDTKEEDVYQFIETLKEVLRDYN